MPKTANRSNRCERSYRPKTGSKTVKNGKNPKNALLGPNITQKGGSEGKMTKVQKVLSHRDLQLCRRPQGASSQSKISDLKNFLSFWALRKVPKITFVPTFEGEGGVWGTKYVLQKVLSFGVLSTRSIKKIWYKNHIPDPKFQKISKMFKIEITIFWGPYGPPDIEKWSPRSILKKKFFDPWDMKIICSTKNFGEFIFDRHPKWGPGINVFSAFYLYKWTELMKSYAFPGWRPIDFQGVPEALEHIKMISKIFWKFFKNFSFFENFICLGCHDKSGQKVGVRRPKSRGIWFSYPRGEKNFFCSKVAKFYEKHPKHIKSDEIGKSCRHRVLIQKRVAEHIWGVWRNHDMDGIDHISGPRCRIEVVLTVLER